MQSFRFGFYVAGLPSGLNGEDKEESLAYLINISEQWENPMWMRKGKKESERILQHLWLISIFAIQPVTKSGVLVKTEQMTQGGQFESTRL